MEYPLTKENINSIHVEHRLKPKKIKCLDGKVVSFAYDPHYIYKIRNTRNNKIYVGRSQRVRARLLEHMYQIKGRRHANITDYDDEYVFEVMNGMFYDRYEKMVAERYYMAINRSYLPEYGYNTKEPYFQSLGERIKANA